MDKLSNRLSALAEKATKGPWSVSGGRVKSIPLGRNAQAHFIGPDTEQVAAVFYDVETGVGYIDAHLLVELVNNLPTIISALQKEAL